MALTFQTLTGEQLKQVVQTQVEIARIRKMIEEKRATMQATIGSEIAQLEAEIVARENFLKTLAI